MLVIGIVGGVTVGHCQQPMKMHTEVALLYNLL